MVYKNWAELIDKLKRKPKVRLVVVAAEDAQTVEAVANACNEGVITPILVGDMEKISAQLGKYNITPNIYHEPDHIKAAEKAVSLINSGDGDILMKGILNTSELLKAVVDKEKGLRTGNVMSHMAILEIPAYHKMLVITDGGMIPHPDLLMKKAIVNNAVAVMHRMGYQQPKVAVLAGVEHINDKMPETIDADALKQMNQKGEIAGCIIEGPISLDLSLVKSISAVKGYESDVAGDADILLCPDIASGNILCKALVEMAGARHAGIVTGASVPIIVTSRGSSADEKYLSILFAASFV